MFMTFYNRAVQHDIYEVERGANMRYEVQSGGITPASLRDSAVSWQKIQEIAVRFTDLEK